MTSASSLLYCPMKDLKNKVAVVTGAGSGIGKQLAHQLARAGAELVLADVAEKNLQATVGKLHGQTKITSHVVDVSKREQVYALADAALKDHGQVMAVGRYPLQKILKVISLDIGMNQLLSLPVHHTCVHLARMQIDSAIEFSRRCVILHLASPQWWFSWVAAHAVSPHYSPP